MHFHYTRKMIKIDNNNGKCMENQGMREREENAIKKEKRIYYDHDLIKIPFN